MSAFSHLLPMQGSRRQSVAGARLVKKSDDHQLIKVSIYVRRNPNPPADALQAVEKSKVVNPSQRTYVKEEQFNSVFGADPQDLEKIVSWAHEAGLKVLDTCVAKRRVLVEGTIADVSRAVGVVLNEYEHPKYGRFRGREGVINVPGDLHGIIEGVFGLDTRPVGKPRRRSAKLAPKLATGATNPFPGTFFPPVVAALYNYPAETSGTGQNIAIFAFNGPPSPDPRGGYKLSSLQNYFQNTLSGTMPTITDVVVQGAGNVPGPDSKQSEKRGDSTGEVMLDMCVVGSVAPGAKIFMYFTEFSEQGWVDAINEAITDQNNISVISISYGNPEDGPGTLFADQTLFSTNAIQNIDLAFQAGAAKGITICCASGDDGSGDGEQTGAHVDFPASSPNALGVGGTTLVASSSSIQQETVWNEVMKDEGAGGGGISTRFSKPAYQNSVNVPASANPTGGIGRGVPDVAAVADPETGVVVMRIDGVNLEQIGGTSASAPLWAALVARLNEALGTRCGFLNSVLYAKCATGVLNDITVGDNGDYTATTGWDACTGLGTPDGTKLLQALKP